MCFRVGVWSILGVVGAHLVHGCEHLGTSLAWREGSEARFAVQGS